MNGTFEHEELQRFKDVSGQFHRLTIVSESAVVALQVGAHPARSRASMVAVMLQKESDPIVLVELELALPPRLWELRGSGVWADHICETPAEHWSYGLEAFALAIDNSRELLGRGLGTRVPLGWELEFEGSPTDVASGQTGQVSPTGYRQVGLAHGVLLTQEGELPFEGAALRQHWWGDPEKAEVVDFSSGQIADPGSAQSVYLPVGDTTWRVDRTDRGSVNWVVKK